MLITWRPVQRGRADILALQTMNETLVFLSCASREAHQREALGVFHHPVSSRRLHSTYRRKPYNAKSWRHRIIIQTQGVKLSKLVVGLSLREVCLSGSVCLTLSLKNGACASGPTRYVNFTPIIGTVKTAPCLSTRRDGQTDKENRGGPWKTTMDGCGGLSTRTPGARGLHSDLP